MATYPWLEDVTGKSKYQLNGGPLHGKEVMLSDGTTAVMWIRGFYGRYRLRRRCGMDVGLSEWEPISWFGYLASR